MRTDLKHLPGGKQRELAYLVEILLEEFGKIIATRKAPRLKGGQVLKIVLFGSYARGDWVEDPIGRYFSDYDLLIVVDHEDLADTVEFWETAEARILKELSAGQHLRTPVNFIVHSLQDVNHQLERGRYFFVDIVRDGILLHNLRGHALANPAALAPETALDEARGYFEDGKGSAERRLELAGFAMDKEYNKEAAFELHQAAEWLYNTLLLTLTLYTPKSHNLVRLRNLTEPLDPRLASIWPTETKFEKRCFELLRAAYIKARYSRHYKVSQEELAWLRERVILLQTRVGEICEERIATLEAAVLAAE
ncbi:HEPN domain-containing protein [Phenylobacterium sp.]|uniref:HEPN domain-containing protein n=1 Tax=Phenylobacterium sp. TaxID=1871053 RepID=UPI002FC8219E